MLVLSRVKNQDIVIVTPEGRKIVVCVVEIDGSKVRLGIDAEQCVRVDRGEIHLARQTGFTAAQDGACELEGVVS